MQKRMQKMPALFALLALLVCGRLAGGSPSAAQSAKTAEPVPGTEAWTPDDMVFFDVADQFRISPDGKWVLWVRTVPDKKRDSRATQLMLSSMTTSDETQLTREIDNVAQPRWSPDGKLIAFLSSRALPDSGSPPGKQHIWFINPFGGEPWPALSTDFRFKHFEWRDNDSIIFGAAEDSSLFESQNDEKKDDTRVVDDTEHAAPVRLFRFSIKDKNVTRLTNNDRWIENFDLSPDGKYAVISEGRELSYQWDRRTAPAVWIWNFSTGERKQIFTEGNVHPRVLKWAADSSGIYAIAPFSTVMAEPSGFARLVYFYDLGTGATTNVNLDWEKGVGFLQRFEVTPDGFLVFLADGVRFKPARYTRHGATWSREWLQGEHDRNYFNFAVAKDGRSIVYEYSTASTPWRWYRAQLDGARVLNPAPLVDVYARYRKKKTAKTEIIHWKGANDEEVDGILYYPDDYQPGKRYPLITYTHGGPMGADMDAWSANPAYAANLLTQRGAFVLETNYHGSANYGAKWAESICCGKYYELEIPDIEKGVDSLIAKGLVDADRVGAFGWSNGAILSTQLNVADPDRYKATVVGAGDVEYVSDWANSEYGEAFDNFYFGKSPFEDAELYFRKSPIYKFDRVRTPTLIMHGTIDQNVPTEQGWLHYRSLYYLQKAPVRFILFPGEEHFPMKLSHQLRVTTEEMAWFDKYLFHAKAPKSEALKDGSPLAELLDHPVRKSGSLYGIELAGRASGAAGSNTILIPEVVSRGAFDVGRFEVTRAQFAAFDKQYKFDSGAENFPASGITYEKAKDYCAWLSKETGETYRLPNKDEAKTLYGARSGENTLDFWAGYSVNPDDAQKLEELIAGLAPDSLLKPVGSFPGAAGPGEDAVFDLGGNVAEWTESANGGGELSGGSVDRPADAKTASKPTNISFAGFRVVRETPKSK